MTGETLQNCPICERTRAKVAPFGARDASVFECPVCGKFAATRPMLVNLAPIEDRRLLRYLSVHTRRESEAGRMALLKTDWSDFAYPHSLVPLSQRIRRLLEVLRDRTKIAGEEAFFSHLLDYPLIGSPAPEEARFLSGHLVEAGKIEGGQNFQWRITVKGWEELEATGAGGVKGRAFVAMSFCEELTEAFDHGILPAVTDCGLPTPVRVDREEYNEKICDRIIAEIRQAQFLIADFTYHRAGVYFEAGFALGIGRPVIWMCREDEIEKAHFDTRQYNHITWKTPDELRRRLCERILATIPYAAELRAGAGAG